MKITHMKISTQKSFDRVSLGIYFNEMLHVMLYFPSVAAITSCYRTREVKELTNGPEAFVINKVFSSGHIDIHLTTGSVIRLSYSSKERWEEVLRLVNDGYIIFVNNKK